jgi:hypothetical protein
MLLTSRGGNAPLSEPCYAWSPHGFLRNRRGGSRYYRSLTAPARDGALIERPGREDAPRGPNKRIGTRRTRRMRPMAVPNGATSQFPFPHIVERSGSGSGKSPLRDAGLVAQVAAAATLQEKSR